MDALVGIIANRHSVSPQQVTDLLALRRTYLDVLVFASFAALFSLASIRLNRRIYQSPLGDSRWLAGGAVVLAAPVISLAAVYLGMIWSGVIEVVRVGNQHLSNRVNRIPWMQLPWEIFVVGVVLFLAVAVLYYRFGRWDTDRIRPRLIPS